MLSQRAFEVILERVEPSRLFEFDSADEFIQHCLGRGLVACEGYACVSPQRVPVEALERIEGGALAQTLAITVRSVSGEPFERIVDYDLGAVPEPLTVDTLNDFDSDDIPF